MSGAPCELQRAQPWLGTLVTISVSAAPCISVARVQDFLDAAFGEVARVQRCMSYHDAHSTLSHINRHAATRAIQADPDTAAVLRAALEFAAASDGAFDPTVAAQLEEWGYLPPLLPPPRARPGDWRAVELDPEGRVRFHRPLRLDLGGIAKGYAVDLASQMLTRPEIDRFSVNAGGDLRVGGARPQTISLRDPRSPARVAHQLQIRQGAVATSGSYFSARRMAHAEVSHLVDARRGKPFLRHELSVTVRAPRCMEADALTKVVLFAERAQAQALLERNHAEAFVLQAAAAA